MSPPAEITTRCAFLATLTLGLVLGACCKDDAPRSGCASDDECRGGRVCVAGACIDPNDIGVDTARDTAVDTRPDVPDDVELDVEPDLPDIGPDLPPGDFDVTIVVENVGDIPTYVAPGYRGERTYLGVSLQSEQFGEMGLGAGCSTICDECVPIACEAPPQLVRQLLPGDRYEVAWDGVWYARSTCDSPDFGEVGCHDVNEAPLGVYSVSVCYSRELVNEGGDGFPARRVGDDLIEPAAVVDPVCETVDFEVVEGSNTVTVTLEPLAEDTVKEFAGCGQAWTWYWDAFPFPEPEVSGTSSGETTKWVVGPWDGGPPSPAVCVRRGYMRALVGDMANNISVRGGVWGGQWPCQDEEPADEAFAFLFSDLEAGSWTAWVETPASFQPDPVFFDVELCDSCTCDIPPGTPFGSPCDLDCDCAEDLGAVCYEGGCQIPCLSNNQCPGNTICESDPDPDVLLPAVCEAQSEDQCRSIWDCHRGQTCLTDGNALARCVPDFDMRGLDVNSGRGFYCGCDAECPGAQSCVRFEINFTEGHCAFRCRDARDCPADWACIGDTSSGLEAVCVPP